MSKTSCKLLIVEGEDQEIRILDYVKRIFFPKKNFQFITLSAIKIFNEELKLIQNTNSLFVLSGIPAFILDYFDKSFWRSFIKRKELKRNICNQKI